MSVILDFEKDEKEFFTKIIEHEQYLDFGSEANCYLKDNCVYKIYNEEMNHRIHNTICKDDLDIESFIFPDEIYTCEDDTFACKMRYIPYDYLDKKKLRKGITPNVEKIKKALHSFIKDIYLLSQNNIYTYDLDNNTLFDGEKLYAIDTLSYKIVEYDPYERNVNLVKEAILNYIDFFEFYFMNRKHEDTHYKQKLEGLLPYIDEIATQIEKDETTKQKTFIN